jgi:complex iron-sulfur molybdoenzyme family reductase subunit gamma
MLSRKVSKVSALLDPKAKGWQKVEREVIDLAGMPVHLQTSRYVRTVWADKLIGKVRAVSVRSAHDGERVAIQMEWADDTKNTEFADRLFPDAAAAVFPSNGNAPLITLGAPDAKVNAWMWRADLEQGENLVAHGLGTDAPAEGAAIDSRAVWEDGRWSVVLSRSLKAKGANNVKLTPGKTAKVGFTIWEGSNRERGDLRSYSRDWRELTLES